MQCGLLGEKLGHSYSPQIHRLLGDYAYSLFEVPPDALGTFLRQGDFSGLNVTIPYKKAVIPYCAALSPRAKAVGAVNTIVRRPDGTLIGHNTDYFGFERMLASTGLSAAGKKALVLGSGGASNTAAAVLRAAGAEVVVISRTGENNYQNLDRHADARLLVNTTPVGMFPNVEESPISLEPFGALEGVLDVIFNPARTKLLMDAQRRGLVTCGGLQMLVSQAKESAEWFTGHAIDDGVIPDILCTIRAQTENIILIGMPGCGKTTVGQILAKKTGRPFRDADAEIEAKAGMSIPEIFARCGEDGFRALETQVLAELGRQSGCIIATGGGCVTRACNYPLLHRNGVLFCLNRGIDHLPTAGRPLSQNGDLQEMYRIRRPLYQRFADVQIDCTGTPEAAAMAILASMEGET